MKFWPLMTILLALPAWSGSIIKCRAADGSITFADTRCPAGHEQLSKKSYQQRRLQQKTSIKNLESGSEYPASEATGKIPTLVFQGRFAQAMSSANTLKMSLIEYFIYRDKWPASLEDLGMDPASMTSSQIDATEITDQGRLRLKLNADFGDNKEIWLYPKEVMGGTQIEWNCFSNFPATMLTSPAGIALCQSRYF